MKNPSASNKQGSISATAQKLTIRHSIITAVVVLALLTSLTGVRPLPSSRASAESSVQPAANLMGSQAEANQFFLRDSTDSKAEAKELSVAEAKELSVAEAKAMSGGRMSDEEAAAFANFINTAAAEDICWKDTNPRGVGTIPDRCPAGSVSEGLLCYKNCPAGYSTTPGGLICGKNCPAGWRDDGTACWIDATTITKKAKPCPDGWRDDGTACWVDLDIYGNGCSGNCRPGYTNDGCTCRRPPQRQNKEWEPCPPDYTDFGLTCTRNVQRIGKDLVPRGEVKTRGCGPGMQEQAGLCYRPCPSGSVGVGPLCWVNCPTTFPENCGAACAIGRAQCAVAVIKMVVATGDMTLNVAGLLSGAGAAKAAIQAGIKAASRKVLTAAGRKALLQQAKRKLIETARKNGKELAEELLNKSSEALVSSYENGQFDWTVLDPTGIAAVVEAFNKPICGR
jgi:hypothetical protein